MEKKKIQWHPAFCSAVKLELSEDHDGLDYVNEYNLNSKPLQVDLLIIKKKSETIIKNQIGRIFRKHNICEYKSPEDTMGIDEFIKVIGYACIYKANEKHVGEMAIDDITITLVRESYPENLINWLRENDYDVYEKYPGIYYVEKAHSFPIQIIVSKKLDKQFQKWLTLLNGNLSKEDARRAVAQSMELKEKYEKDYADSVLQVSVMANKVIFDSIRKEEAYMCQALRELMADDLMEAEEKGLVEGQRQERENTIIHVLKKGKTPEEIAEFNGYELEEVKKVAEKYACMI